ncbi:MULTISPECIES: efflux RND transporter periplasmic adaptor subunit [unclassified Pedobacter]|uniref:efflux RND transporter periplasmic adaptor subunit n=1 Tax=unclassified Pedobacter TaxID=2628915 RepID=UPI00142181E6|nr:MULTISPECIES: efflux RND transporter periplasmic adaptor subunit [unclassified Pedobacter]NII83482.1 RND family efflux transporter MFP subunit [Pedobacter sp. SG908]NMN37346.1 RND family efflux transporter MFP subunit [Pedobacter sp. SG918]
MNKTQLTLIALTSLLFACKEKPKNTNPLGQPDIISVKVAPISSFGITNSIQVTGLVGTENEANYSFKIGGVISSILVDEGQFFKKGQLLATLNTTEIAAGLAQANLGVDKAVRDYARAVNLYKDSVFTLEQLQNTKTALDVAKKTSEATAFNQRYARIYAASDGFVTKKVASVGEVIGGGMPVLMTGSTQKTDSYLLKVGVTDLEWAGISAGQRAVVYLDGYPEQPFQATVLRKLQSADAAIGSFQVELKLQMGNLKPAIGMFGKAEIETNTSENRTVIPFSALVEADGETGYIFTPKGTNSVRKVPVTILKFDNKNVYLKDKLEGIDRIVISNSAYLNEQSTVKIIK